MKYCKRIWQNIQENEESLHCCSHNDFMSLQNLYEKVSSVSIITRSWFWVRWAALWPGNPFPIWDCCGTRIPRWIWRYGMDCWCWMLPASSETGGGGKWDTSQASRGGRQPFQDLWGRENAEAYLCHIFPTSLRILNLYR